ncbi:ankyrin repeat domain-containing protein [Burkholderia alba]|uniref:ankyrin repeat domain-containing protein n=1 Tax=Burkholderia alba TaxID=2683677 RepID=UPI002B05824B|nr:ankyrin repeat domain-containing protein [Burkholderia alba]
MRYKHMTAVGAIVAAAGLSAPFWWPANAQGTNMSGFHRYPPEDFFSGAQLELAKAIRDGNLARVRELAPKTDLAELGNKKTSVLAFAVQEAVPVKGDAANVRNQIISELVKDGAKPDQSFGANDANVAYIAAKSDTTTLLAALLAGGMTPDLRYDGDTPLIFAAADNRQLPQLKLLIEHRANVNLRDSLGETALFEATRLRQWDAVDYLLAHGADPTVANKNGLKFAKTLFNELTITPKDSPQLPRVEAIRKRVVAAGVQWPPA